MSVTYEIMYDWATVVGKLLTGSVDGKNYAPSYAYIEFENNGGAPVTPPTLSSRAAGVSYYQALSGTKDYLRVPLTASTLTSTDDDLYPGGNLCTFFAQTAGALGENGLTFSHTVSSRVYGIAIVAAPEVDDPTQDLVVARAYYDTSNQVVKVSGSQISLTVTLPIT